MTVTPADGYTDPVVSVKDAKGNAQTVDKGTDGKYTFKMPDTDATVTVTFSKIEYTINSGEQVNGKFEVAGKATVGDTVEIKPTANEGYEVSEVKYNETVITAADGKYTFTMPAPNVTVTGTFTAKADGTP